MQASSTRRLVESAPGVAQKFINLMRKRETCLFNLDLGFSELARPYDEIYKKALEMTDKAPGLHAELQKQLAEQVRDTKHTWRHLLFFFLTSLSLGGR